MIHDLIELDRPLISVDLETTGLYPNVDRIVQIGVIKVFPDGNIREWESLINPGIKIPQNAMECHRITDEMVKDAPRFKQIAEKLYIGFKGCDLLGYNVKSFDVKFLIEEFARCGMPFVPGRIVDSFKIFTKYNPRNLTAAVQHYLGEELVGAHSAIIDAKAAMRVFRAQLEKHPDLPRTIDGIETFFKPNGNFVEESGKFVWSKDGEAMVNFGSKNGVLLKNVEPAYLQWILRANFSEEVKVIVRDAIAGKYPKKS